MKRLVALQLSLETVLMIERDHHEYAAECQEGTDLGKAGEKVVRGVICHHDGLSQIEY